MTAAPFIVKKIRKTAHPKIAGPRLMFLNNTSEM